MSIKTVQRHVTITIRNGSKQKRCKFSNVLNKNYYYYYYYYNCCCFCCCFCCCCYTTRRKVDRPTKVDLHCDYSLGEERANLSAFRTFVRFVLVWFYRFPLPLGVWKGLRFVIVALPGLFSYLFFFFFFFFFFFCRVCP